MEWGRGALREDDEQLEDVVRVVDTDGSQAKTWRRRGVRYLSNHRATSEYGAERRTHAGGWTFRRRMRTESKGP